MSRRTTDEVLEEALAHLEVAETYAEMDLSQQVVLDAASLRLSAGIEALSRLDRPIRSALFGELWSDMWGMRNRIAHGYLLVDSRIVRKTLTVGLPSLVRILREERKRIAEGA